MMTRFLIAAVLSFSAAAAPLYAEGLRALRQLQSMNGGQGASGVLRSFKGFKIQKVHLEEDNRRLSALYKRVLPAIVKIGVQKEGGESGKGGVGSGFIVDGAGLVLTNAHVVKEAGVGGTVKVLLTDGRTATGRVADFNTRRDLAVVWIDQEWRESRAKSWPVLELGSEDAIEVGHLVSAIGSPFGLGKTATYGRVSYIGRAIGAQTPLNFIQVDTPINPGNSGGPLLDISGKVVGVNTAIYSQSGGSVGIGFAIPVGVVKRSLAQYAKTESIASGWLGIKMAVRREKGLPVGVKVEGTVKDSPAEKAGLQEDDAIVAVDGHSLPSSEEAIQEVAMYGAVMGPGDVLQLEIARKGQRLTIPLTLGKFPAAPEEESAEPEKEQTPEAKPEEEKEIDLERLIIILQGRASKVRAAIAAYYEEAGEFPADIASLIPKHLDEVPEIRLPGKEASREVVVCGKAASKEEFAACIQASKGRWYYVKDPKSPYYGKFGIESMEMSPLGVPWFAL